MKEKTKICPFMSTPKQGDTICGGEKLYRDKSEMMEYGFTPIDGKIWSGLLPCLKENCMALEKLHCLKCKYEWYPRSETPPRVCPNCKSYEWDKNRVRVIAK